jgi:16S rRNA (cytosine1402-N4)-methyltransferase
VHKSVLLHETLKYLNCKENSVVLDCTVGCAGHALEILKIISPKGLLVGIDADNAALEEAEKRLKIFKGSFKLFHDNFIDFDKVLNDSGIKEVDAMLFDLGISSFQLDDGQRGFSFKSKGPLDMRMDKTKGLPLWRVLETMPENQIGVIIKDLGEERYWRRIARAIVEARRIAPIHNSCRLAEIITSALGYKRGSRINPATKAFQAFRIFINDELNAIRGTLLKAPEFLRKGGRIVVISFHSLEDRIVKHSFKAFSESGMLKTLTKRPVSPSEREISENPRSRSAKLRSAERV